MRGIKISKFLSNLFTDATGLVYREFNPVADINMVTQLLAKELYHVDAEKDIEWQQLNNYLATENVPKSKRFYETDAVPAHNPAFPQIMLPYGQLPSANIPVFPPYGPQLFDLTPPTVFGTILLFQAQTCKRNFTISLLCRLESLLLQTDFTSQELSEPSPDARATRNISEKFQRRLAQNREAASESCLGKRY